MEIILSFFLPLLWIYYFYRKDPHPEPIPWLTFAFLLGILSAILSYKIEQSLFNLGLNLDSYVFLLLAVFSEEFFKFLVILVFIFPKKVFDEPIDAMIYMMFSAFGFAFIENLNYLVNFKLVDSYLNVNLPISGVFFIAIMRFLGPNLIHILSSSLIGFGYSLYVNTRHFLTFLLSFLSGVFLHFIFNFVIIKSSEVDGDFYWIGLLLPLIWSAFWVVIFELDYLSIKNGRKQQSNSKSS